MICMYHPKKMKTLEQKKKSLCMQESESANSLKSFIIKVLTWCMKVFPLLTACLTVTSSSEHSYLI